MSFSVCLPQFRVALSWKLWKQPRTECHKKNLKVARGLDVPKSLQGAGKHQGVPQSTGLVEGSAGKDFCTS